MRILHRGYAKKRLGDKKGAIADYTKAIELNPQYADAYYSRGNAKIRFR
jgi:tetratricopeptide (TPR) repeat protein